MDDARDCDLLLCRAAADLQALARRANVVEAIDVLEADEVVNVDEVLLHHVDEAGAAGDDARLFAIVTKQAVRLRQCGGRVELEVSHFTLP